MTGLDPQDATDLLEPLIEGLVEDPLWFTFLARLRRRTSADYASLVFRPLPGGTPANRVIHLYSGNPSPPIVTQLYRDSLYQRDPMPYHDMRDGRVFALPDLIRSGDPDHESYRNEMLVPSGMNLLRMMRVVEASGVSAWLTISRQTCDFDVEHEALIAGLGPYLRAAVGSYVAIERERMSAYVASDAIRRMNFGWLTLDADGRILDTDAHGAAMLAASSTLARGRNGKLTARSPGVAREITGAIKVLASDPRSRPRAIVLSHDPWLDMLLVSSPIRTGTTRPAPTLVAYVHADNWSTADRCDQLCELFNLIPSEARLALALSRGLSLAEAAGALSITVESARTYSKRIYAKTGARGQSDLVRFIHRSVLAIA